MTEVLIRLLLALVPKTFRSHQGAEILDVYRARLNQLDGRWARATFKIREIGGMLGLVLHLHLHRRPSARSQHSKTGGSVVFDSVFQDVRFAARTIRGNLGFSLMVVLVLGLGIGATSAIFSATNAFLFRPLPFQESGRLMRLFETNPEFGWTHQTAAPANALDWREQVDAFEDLAIYTDWVTQATLFRDGEPELRGVTSVSGNFFQVLGVPPAMGRVFTWDETWAGGEEVVVVSHSFWESFLGGDPNSVGTTVDVGNTTARVVGVMPPGFSFPNTNAEIWSPWGWNPEDREAVWFRRAHMVNPVARLKPGVTRQEADAQLQVVVERLKVDFPETNRVMGAGLMPLRAFLIREVRTPLMVLLGAVGLLLILACSNVANLMLVRGTERSREFSVRFALGAQRFRVVRLMLVESLFLSFLGGAVGLWIGWMGVRLAERVTPLGIDGATHLALDHRVVLFTMAVSAVTGILVGIAPALRAVGGRISEALKEGSRSGTPGRRFNTRVNALVAGEVALAFLVVAGAGLMVRSFVYLRNVDPGFTTEGTLAVQFSVPSARYPGREEVLALYDGFLDRLEASPGIHRAGTVQLLPLMGTSWSSQLKGEHWPEDRVGFEILHRRADRGYFDALQIPLLQGRFFASTDRPEGPQVVLINQTFARQHFPDEDPLGQRITFDQYPDGDSNWYEIVGIVGDQHQVNPGLAPQAEVFENRDQDWGRTSWIVMRVQGEPLDAVPTVRAVLKDLDPLVALAEIRPLKQVWQESMARERFLLALFSAFGIVALILASAGVYGVAAQAGRRRRQEIGIRVAMGAADREIYGLILGQALVVVGGGLLVGLGVSFLATRALVTLLHGVRPTDPGTLLAVMGLLGGVALLASLIPARRATTMDPVESLRVE